MVRGRNESHPMATGSAGKRVHSQAGISAMIASRSSESSSLLIKQQINRYPKERRKITRNTYIRNGRLDPKGCV